MVWLLSLLGCTPETIPPLASFPRGRIRRGCLSNLFPDPMFEALLTAQGMQSQVIIDTSWLSVAHGDETLSFVKASSPRGWVMLANDAALAKTMLQTAQSQGYGSTCLLYTSDAADERSSVDLGGRRIIKKKKHDTVEE